MIAPWFKPLPKLHPQMRTTLCLYEHLKELVSALVARKIKMRYEPQTPSLEPLGM